MTRCVALALVVALLAAPRAGAAEAAKEPPRPTVIWTHDAVTVRAEQAPASTVVSLIGKESGAQVRGVVPPERTVTLDLEKVPVKEALERILGEQNFTLTYADDGTLKTIELKGWRQEAPPTTVPAPDVAGRDRGDTPEMWYRMYLLFEDRQPVAVDGKVAEVSGKEQLNWDYLANVTYGVNDAQTRREAVRTAMRAIESDPEFKAAILSAARGVSAADFAQFARATTFDRAEELMRNIARESKIPEFQQQARAVLIELRKIPFKGPSPLAGDGPK
ncbi:MAG: hypothetical protein KIT14_18655 [bacterium]|nr:hypothetical protein [bacterium]